MHCINVATLQVSRILTSCKQAKHDAAQPAVAVGAAALVAACRSATEGAGPKAAAMLPALSGRTPGLAFDGGRSTASMMLMKLCSGK